MRSAIRLAIFLGVCRAVALPQTFPEIPAEAFYVGPQSSDGASVNLKSEMAGYTFPPTSPFAWRPMVYKPATGPYDPLGGTKTGRALGHNTLGDTLLEIAAEGSSVLYADGTTWTPLNEPTLTRRNEAGLLDLNDKGEAAGFGYTLSGALRAYVRSRAQGMRFLEPLTGDVTSVGELINRRSQVVGRSFSSTGTQRFVFYDPVTGAQAIQTPGGSQDCLIPALSDAGEVAGMCAAATSLQPFLWSRTEGLRTLPLPPEGAAFVVSSVNSYGQVIGALGDGPVLYMHGLGYRRIVPSASGPFAGTPLQPVDINDYGAMTGRTSLDDNRRAVLARFDCDFRIAQPHITMPAGPGGGSTNVDAGAGCPYLPKSGVPWMAVQGGARVGSALLGFTVGMNAGPLPRTGTIAMMNRVVHVVQKSPVTPQNYTDVAPANPFYDYIEIFRAQGITSGCSASPPMFCPDAFTTRAQMAVFLIRAIFKGDNFTSPATPYFTDVPSTHFAFRHIQKMRELGITSGCSATPAMYCPDHIVTRGQMAVFLVRSKFGEGFGIVAGSTDGFTDVPASSSIFRYVQKMDELGITSGCGPSTYCPDLPTTRGQMAVFVVRAMLTPLGVLEP